MPKLIDLTGKRFGRLTVIERYGTVDGHAAWKCKCDCGNKTVVNGKWLRAGKTTSCGCYHKELLAKRSKTHGMTKTRLYSIWHDMKNRCFYQKDKSFEDYGGRGITVCEEWKNSFESFRDWSLLNGYSDNLTIDRINNDGNYDPSNCRWVTMKEQCSNRRKRGTLYGSK